MLLVDTATELTAGITVADALAIGDCLACARLGLALRDIATRRRRHGGPIAARYPIAADVPLRRVRAASRASRSQAGRRDGAHQGAGPDDVLPAGD
jgi:hypothetical protein